MLTSVILRNALWQPAKNHCILLDSLKRFISEWVTNSGIKIWQKVASVDYVRKKTKTQQQQHSIIFA